MEWFEGGIPAAISEAKSRKSLFVVAVHHGGDKEKADAFLNKLNCEEFCDKLKANRAVCIKVENGSEICNQFTQIYPVFLVPSVYFINALTGVDVEATGGDEITPEKLVQSVDKALEAVAEKHTETVGVVEDVSSPRGSRVEEAQKTLQESLPSSNDGASAASTSQPPQVSLEERVSRAKELLAARKAMKEKVEEETSKNQEIERRELGKQMADMKRKKEEDEIRQAAEERRRDKDETRLARERIKAQIEQDRLERAAKFNLYEKEKLEKAKEKEKEKMAEAARLAEEEMRKRSSIARIQFRLPDGRSQMKQFSPEDQLQSLYSFVSSDIPLGFSNFSLSTTFPSKQLDNESKTASLRSLGLVPSSTVLILPKSSSNVAAFQSQDGGFMSLIWLLLLPFTSIYNFVVSFFSSNQNENRSSSNPDAASSRRERNVKRDGNIARLGNSSDDDENNTYNGNSTQQM